MSVGYLKKNNRILIVAGVFPPLKAQMSWVIFKYIYALEKNGNSIDIIIPPIQELSQPNNVDSSLEKFVSNVIDSDFVLPNRPLLTRWVPYYYRKHLFLYNDSFSPFVRSAAQMITKVQPEKYDFVLSFSPNHTVNLAMIKAKRKNPNLFWSTHFSDPWSNNPIEVQYVNKIWSQSLEKKMLRHVDCLIHNSRSALDCMLQNKPEQKKIPNGVFPHVYIEEFYPKREKKANKKITIRFLGTLFGKRTPEPIFRAFLSLFERRPELKDKINLELIGEIQDETVLCSPSYEALPKGFVSHTPPVNYTKSLELMYDADVLLLIEADVENNLFSPSKLADYLGANTPIVALTNGGEAHEICKKLKTWNAASNDVEHICKNIEDVIYFIQSNKKRSWCNQKYRKEFDGALVMRKYTDFLASVKGSPDG